jgi:hypothetical protein
LYILHKADSLAGHSSPLPPSKIAVVNSGGPTKIYIHAQLIRKVASQDETWRIEVINARVWEW